MQDNDSIGFRSFLGWAAMILGALVGWGLVEWAWRFNNQGIHMWWRPERGWGYALIAMLCSLSVGIVAMALARFRDLPNDESDESATSKPS